MDLGKHAATIWMCYGVVTLVLGGLILWLNLEGRRLARQLVGLEDLGIRRRSTETSEPEPNTRA